MTVPFLSLRPSEYSPAVLWLSDHRVPGSRIAAAFRVSTGHVRVLRHRARQPHRPSIHDDVRQHRLTRDDEDAVVTTATQRERFDRWSARLELIERTFMSMWELPIAVAELRALLPLSGWPVNTELVRLSARTRQLLAWCYTHQGAHRAALDQARLACKLFLRAYRHAEAWQDLMRIGETTLIASEACLSACDPESAHLWLDRHAQAHARSGEPLNVEYFRQRGAALFQRGQDEAAAIQFRQAAQAAIGVEDPWWAAHAGDRHLSLTGRADWTLAERAFVTIRTARPAASLEVLVARNWAAAAALATDSCDAPAWVEHELTASLSQVAPFPHQRAVTELLLVTPTLKLSSALRCAWIRWLLYADIARSR